MLHVRLLTLSQFLHLVPSKSQVALQLVCHVVGPPQIQHPALKIARQAYNQGTE